MLNEINDYEKKCCSMINGIGAEGMKALNALDVPAADKYVYKKLIKHLDGLFSKKGNLIFDKTNSSRENYRKVPDDSCYSDLEIENLGNKDSLFRKVADKEDETKSHKSQSSLVDVQVTKLSPNGIEVDPSEPKMVKEEMQMPKKDLSNEGSGSEENKSTEIIKKKCRKSRKKKNKEKHETLVYDNSSIHTEEKSRSSNKDESEDEYEAINAWLKEPFINNINIFLAFCTFRLHAICNLKVGWLSFHLKFGPQEFIFPF